MQTGNSILLLVENGLLDIVLMVMFPFNVGVGLAKEKGGEVIEFLPIEIVVL